MEETEQEILEKIRDVEADIKSIKEARKARNTPFTEKENDRLDVFYRLLAALRKEKNALRAENALQATGAPLTAAHSSHEQVEPPMKRARAEHLSLSASKEVQLDLRNSFFDELHIGVWAAIVAGQVAIKNLGKTGEIWMLPGSARFIGGATRMLNRSSYSELWNDITFTRTAAIDRVPYILIVGTPGIGKTMFLNRVLFELHAEMKREEDNGGLQQRILVTTRSGAHYLFFIEDGVGVVSPFIGGRVDYWLVDNWDASFRIRYTKLVILVSSGQVNNYKEYGKRMDENYGAVFYMNLWTLDELLAIAPSNWTKDFVEFRYDVFGGSARNIFAMTHSKVPFWNESVAQWMEIYFKPRTANNPSNDAWRFQWESVLSRLTMSMESDDKKTSPESQIFRPYFSMTVHKENGKSRWASDFMRSLVGHLCKHDKGRVWDSVMNALGANETAEGVLFESRCHDSIITHPPRLRLRSKDSKSFTLSLDDQGIRYVDLTALLRNSSTSEQVSRVFHIWNPACVAQVPEGSYGWPVKCNFPVIDAIIQPNIMLQFTIAESHKVDVESLEKIRTGLQERDAQQHMLIFVVPADRLKTFRIPQIQGIHMFVSTLDEVSSELFN